MKIGILVAGQMDEEDVARFGSLPDMFAKLLHLADKSLTFVSFDIFNYEFPADPLECEGWIITGSARGAYENLPWMLHLEAFIRDSLARNIPMVGVCFGHQIMAAAMGGVVEKEASGKWGMAVHRYEIKVKDDERPHWMSGEGREIALQASHQDQVVKLPPNVQRLAGSSFCPNGILAYGNAGLSMQLHPELPAAFISTLLDRRAQGAMTPEDVEEARTRVELPVDDHLAAEWIVNFFHQLR